MGKAKGSGGKNRKKGKASASSRRADLVYAHDGEQYAYVHDALGDARYRLLCNDGEERLGILRGRLWKRAWIRRGDVVLVAMRDFQNDKCDIVHKYTSEDVMRLTSCKELSAKVARCHNSADFEVGDPACLAEPEDETLVFEDDDMAFI